MFSVRYEMNMSVYDIICVCIYIYIYIYIFELGRAAIRVNDQVDFESENGNFITRGVSRK